jgi:hypothetical protein
MRRFLSGLLLSSLLYAPSYSQDKIFSGRVENVVLKEWHVRDDILFFNLRSSGRSVRLEWHGDADHEGLMRRVAENDSLTVRVRAQDNVGRTDCYLITGLDISYHGK